MEMKLKIQIWQKKGKKISQNMVTHVAKLGEITGKTRVLYSKLGEITGETRVLPSGNDHQDSKMRMHAHIYRYIINLSYILSSIQS